MSLRKQLEEFMDKEKLESFRRQLVDLQNRITGDYERVVESSSEEFGAEVPDVNDEASRTINRRILLQIGDQSHEILKLIREALERMEAGEYGVCQECDEDIPVKRLELVPYARFCVRCKERLEKESSKSG